ncbi:alkaline phosphatase family protein [Aneurinibacillus thermoaerophilus]|uniref:alkaline phosphatase family protein n=1 Tax=Aneurinibacillus thermoaerophilus TaxID=143495 RepID=UPI002E1A1CB5|nr:alkaline phosphatase family protein [Aneurinibacillus thermoaerophilus]MED0764124.1 alkaline phosphatase family protein [Aneurinibacillus thermoaerophilus]
MSKKIILLLIDSFMPHVLQEAREKGLVPALSFLMEKGAYWDNCVTVFPTMSATVDASLVTGEYPEKHGVQGLIWYHRPEERVVNYINGSKSVWRIGVSKCTKDALIEINETHLSQDVTTVFEELTRRGKTSASFNFSVHRGPCRYRLRKPGILKLILAGLSFERMVSGPEICTIGRFIDSEFLRSFPWKWSHSIFQKYGLNDWFAIDATCRLVKENKLPDLTVVYLPNMDYAYHRKPDQGPQILAKVDRGIQRLLDSFGGGEEAIRQCRFIVVGDHGQTKIGAEVEANIDIPQHFVGMKMAEMKEIKPDSDDVVICNNERMCYFYPLKEGVQEETIKRLLRDSRIDVLAWKERGGVRVRRGEQELFFAPGNKIADEYGRMWNTEGDLSLIDARQKEEGGSVFIAFGDYPDLFSRLYGALYAREGDVIVATAAHGCEFFTPDDPVHRGGASHGSLHAFDSFVGLIITGETKERFARPRIVDLKSYILQQLT